MGKGMCKLAVAVLALVMAQASAASAQPANDDFDNAIEVTGLPFSDTQNTVDATTADDDPDCAGNGHTVWYAFTPDEDARISADTFGSDYDTTLSVYTGDLGSLSQIACNDDTNSLQSRVTFDAVAGETYYFMIGACCDGPGGNLVVSVDVVPPPPPNDDFADAILVDGLPFSDTQNTLGATTDPNDPGICGASNSVWYTFTAPQDMRIVANTFNSDYYAVVTVYNTNLDFITCSDYLTLVDAVVGETYFFAVSAPNGDGGNLVFSVEEAPPQLEFNVSIDRSGSFDPRSGQAMVRGIANCNQPATVDLWGSLRQTVGRLTTISGDFYVFVECNGETPWEVTIVPSSGKFAGGRANASAGGCAQTQFDYVCDDDSRTISLRGGNVKPPKPASNRSAARGG
jgi:hypothetical protein